MDNIIYLNKGYDASPELDSQTYKVKKNNKYGDGKLHRLLILILSRPLVPEELPF